jgi:aryl-alcohol dehydrogenase-like predicted oxidoreductase
MELRPFGKTGMNVSVLGFGGAEIGFLGTPLTDVENLLNAALDAGLNVIDTAECYADSEEKIGRAVGNRREKFHLFTKCGHSSGFDEPDWDVKMLRKSIDRSLQRLQTDFVDLLQLHSCGEELLRQGDVIDVLIRAKEAGKTRFIGYSGDRNDAAYAVASGAFDALQTSVNIADQQAIDLTLSAASAAGLGIIAKRPVANVAWSSEPPEGAYSRPYWERLQKLQYPFLNERIEEAVRIALGFTLAQSGVCTAIVGTQKPGRWSANAKLLAEGAINLEILSEIKARWKEVAPEDWLGQT